MTFKQMFVALSVIALSSCVSAEKPSIVASNSDTPILAKTQFEEAVIKYESRSKVGRVEAALRIYCHNNSVATHIEWNLRIGDLGRRVVLNSRVDQKASKASKWEVAASAGNEVMIPENTGKFLNSIKRANYLDAKVKLLPDDSFPLSRKLRAVFEFDQNEGPVSEILERC